MITVIHRTDVHLSDEAPSSRKDDWNRTILAKLEQVGKIAREVKADAVLDNGDFFHIKSPSRNTHRLVQQVAEVHATYPCPVYGNVGNHDVKYGDYAFLDEAPLGVLFSTGVFRRLYDEHEAVLTKGKLTVRLTGIPYHGTTYDMERFRRIKKGSERWLMTIAHVLASREGGSMFESEDIMRYADLAAFDSDVWGFGHWHKNQGITEIEGGKQIINLGSLSRGSISQDDVKRTPAVAIVRFTDKTCTIEERPLQVEPSEVVFDLDSRIRAETKQMSVQAFVDSIKEALTAPRGKSLIDAVREMPDLPEEVRERTICYLERAGDV